MKIIKRHRVIFALFFLAVGLFPISLCADYKEIDTRHISKSWPSALVKQIEQYQPPKELQEKIDRLLLTDENVALFTDLGTTYGEAWDVARAKLASRGFFFFDRNRGHVFKHDQIPDYIFKTTKGPAFRTCGELMNVARVEEARRIRALAKDNGKENEIIVPQKYAYVLPVYENVHYASQAKILVIAEEIDLTKACAQKCYSEYDEVTRNNINWLEKHGAQDVMFPGNHYPLPGGKVVLVDTEPLHKHSGSFVLRSASKEIKVNDALYSRWIKADGTVERSWSCQSQR